MNKLPREKRTQILSLLCEGTSLRATSRVADVSINTVTKLLVDAGSACSEYQDRILKNLPTKRVQVDECWAFCYAKEKNVPMAKAAPQSAGDIWTWVAIDADNKLVMSWWVGNRDAECARALLADFAGRVANRIQLTSDGLRAYRDAVHDAFLDEVDYAQLVKIYGENPESEKRYSPPPCIGCERAAVSGSPDRKHISTSFVERQNLTLRMHSRRFTRLTNAFSKKAENHVHAVSLHFIFYNFCKLHKSLRVTPAMSAGVTNRLWSVEDIVRMIEEYETAPAQIEDGKNADLERLLEAAKDRTPRKLSATPSNLNIGKIET
jgi:IS1 family transposase